MPRQLCNVCDGHMIPMGDGNAICEDCRNVDVDIAENY